MNLTAYIALCIVLLFVIAYAAYEAGHRDGRKAAKETMNAK